MILVDQAAEDGTGPGAGLRFGRAPGAWPLLGHVVALQRRPLKFLDSLATHGDLVEIRLGLRRAFMLCHPDLAYQVLTDFRAYDRTGPVYDRVRGAMGNGLATATYSDHRPQRLAMQPAFRREHMRGYVAAMQQEVTATMDAWRDGLAVDVVDEMFNLTTTVALRGTVLLHDRLPRRRRIAGVVRRLSCAAPTSGRRCRDWASCPHPATGATTRPSPGGVRRYVT